MTTAGFEPKILANEWPYTNAIDRVDTGINLQGSHIREKKVLEGHLSHSRLQNYAYAATGILCGLPFCVSLFKQKFG